VTFIDLQGRIETAVDKQTVVGNMAEAMRQTVAKMLTGIER
jgi:hypothetical protein